MAFSMRSCLFLTRLGLGVITKWKDNPISKMKGVDFGLGMILRNYAFCLDVLENKVYFWYPNYKINKINIINNNYKNIFFSSFNKKKNQLFKGLNETQNIVIVILILFINLNLRMQSFLNYGHIFLTFYSNIIIPYFSDLHLIKIFIWIIGTSSNLNLFFMSLNISIN